MSAEAPPTEAADGTACATAVGTVSGGPSTDHGVVEPAATAPRYSTQGRLGVGGMGIVERVYDRVLQRPVALKTLRWENLGDARARARFEAEANMTAGLQHPTIVPVHDRGVGLDGRPWYTMKLVEGQTLARATAGGLARRRAIDAVLRVAEAVAYAHRAGVIHRDIKPGNIMIGAFGEVLLLDWGIARRLDVDEAPTGMLGTPAFMAPEQLDRAHLAGRPCDVFALGITLRAVLAGRSPWSGELGAVVAARRADPWPEPAAGPVALRALVRRSTHPEPAERPSAADFAETLRRWSDGELAREQARGLLERARACAPRAEALRAEAATLRARAAAVLDGLPSHAPIAEKRPGWALEDTAEGRLAEAQAAEVEQLALVRSALELAPDLPAARAALNDCYRARLLDAEARGDRRASAEYRTLLEAHDAESNLEWLRGDGRVTVVTDAPGATVEVLRFERRDRRLVPVPVASWQGPLRARPLAMGSYLFRLSAPGRMPVDYPVHIARHGDWSGVRPGGDAPHPIHLPPADSLPPDLRYVPAGWFASGGDPESPDPLPARRLWVDGFVIDRDPVTHARYMPWLDGLVTAGREADALRFAPRERKVGEVDPPLFYGRDAEGRFTLVRAFDHDWTADCPVVRVDWFSAVAFAEGRRAVDGRPWRLPHSLEWDKAARGVDGRPFPWGAHFDPVWACMVASRAGRPTVEPVDGWPDDVGPYGMRGAAGNVRDLCLDRYRREGPEAPHDVCRPVAERLDPDAVVVVKGGNYSSQDRFCRIAGRFGGRAGLALFGVGFRLACAFDPYAPALRGESDDA